MAKLVRFCHPLKELRIHFCPKGEGSKGVREFIEKFYVPLKKQNEKFPILIRECTGIHPKIWARYACGEETCQEVNKKTADDVLRTVEFLNKPK